MIDLLDLHTHTIASGHAYNTLYEMAQAAADKGLSLYGCSEHPPAMPGSCHAFYFSNFKVLPRVIRGVPVLMGTELNILDYTGRVDLEDHYLLKTDYAIASLHTPCIDNHGTREDYTKAYLGAIKHPLIHIIGHPDDSRLPADWDAVAAHGRCPPRGRPGRRLPQKNTSFWRSTAAPCRQRAPGRAPGKTMSRFWLPVCATAPPSS